MTKVSTLRTLLAATLLFSGVACTVHQTDAPPLTGPSDLSLRLDITATPDTITQDGGSQSSIKVTATGPNGQPLPGVSLRIDTAVGGVAQDFGTLSARTVVTDANGIARVVFTAPPGPPPGASTATCASLPGTCVSIIASPTGSDFTGKLAQSVTIRLVPPGVILPPAETPTALFQFSPDKPSVNETVTFDGTASCGGAVSPAGACTSTSAITSFTWNFGDGTSGTGAIVTHRFSSASTFSVTLTVRNDRGGAASTAKAVSVGTSTAPSAEFQMQPSSPKHGEGVVFSATAQPGPGRTLSFKWNFGDPAGDAPGNPNVASGRTVGHTYANAGTYVVVLTVTDDLGQQSTNLKSIEVK